MVYISLYNKLNDIEGDSFNMHYVGSRNLYDRNILPNHSYLITTQMCSCDFFSQSEKGKQLNYLLRKKFNEINEEGIIKQIVMVFEPLKTVLTKENIDEIDDFNFMMQWKENTKFIIYHDYLDYRTVNSS
jgi:hypothetical protein